MTCKTCNGSRLVEIAAEEVGGFVDCPICVEDEADQHLAAKGFLRNGIDALIRVISGLEATTETDPTARLRSGIRWARSHIDKASDILDRLDGEEPVTRKGFESVEAALGARLRGDDLGSGLLEHMVDKLIAVFRAETAVITKSQIKHFGLRVEELYADAATHRIVLDHTDIADALEEMLGEVE